MNIVIKKILNSSIFQFCSIQMLLLFVCACNNQLGNPSISNTESIDNHQHEESFENIPLLKEDSS